MTEDSIMVYVDVPGGMRGNKIHDISVHSTRRENVLWSEVKSSHSRKNM